MLEETWRPCLIKRNNSWETRYATSKKERHSANDPVVITGSVVFFPLLLDQFQTFYKMNFVGRFVLNRLRHCRLALSRLISPHRHSSSSVHHSPDPVALYRHLFSTPSTSSAESTIYNAVSIDASIHQIRSETHH